MNITSILHKDLILNSNKLKSAQGSVFFVKYKIDESQDDEKLTECILKIVFPFYFNVGLVSKEWIRDFPERNLNTKWLEILKPRWYVNISTNCIKGFP